MKIYWLLYFLPFCGGFVVKKPEMRNQFPIYLKRDGNNFAEKGKAFIQISRIDSNLLPVSLLSVVSGLATRPHEWTMWIHSPPFLAATLMLHLMTSASMILNDIQDYDIDCINNPTRPLITGILTVKEATVATVLMFSLYTYLGIQYLPPIMDPIWGTALLLITIYTPVLKKICFIKNLACSSVIAMSVPFIGFSVINPLEDTLPDFHWLLLTTRIVFTTSLFIEMLLDITDMDGDRALNIPTLPVVFDESVTMGIVTGIMSSSLWVSISEARNNIEVGVILITYLPLYYHIIQINKMVHTFTPRTGHQDVYINKQSFLPKTIEKSLIKDAIKQTTKQLGLYLLMMIMMNLECLP